MIETTQNQRGDINQRTYKFGLAVIDLCDTLPQKRSAWVIADQVIRSATSIGANLIEGRAASSRLEYKKFYEIALKSANETKYWLALLRDAKLAEVGKVDELLRECAELANMLASGVMKLKGRKF